MPSMRRVVMAMLLSHLVGGLTVAIAILVAQASQAKSTLLLHAQTDQPQSKPGTPPEPWLKGTTDEKLAQIERHLRGLDVAMAEISYRYGELLIAGKTRNWEYAQYQTEKIDLSLRLAIERRPKRGKSAEPFLIESLAEV